MRDFDWNNAVDKKFEDTRRNLLETLETLVSKVMTENKDPEIVLEEERPKKLTIDLIPNLPITELGWGSLQTPEGGGQAVRTTAGQDLAQYLANIAPDADIRGKIDSLNAFFQNPVKEEPDNPKKQLQQTISALVFFKTLTNIITNFNASAAGFAFESFLAVLLDAQTGKQIPAAEGSTIADIVLFDGQRPISLKLYKEGSLVVGGSYRQLIDDLTGKFPTMEYIAVTKDLAGSGLEAEGKLNFFGFNFTEDNFVEILNIVPKQAEELMAIPEVFSRPIPELEKLIKTEDFAEFIRVPTGRETNYSKIAKDFVERVKSQVGKLDLDPNEVGSLLEKIIDLDTGLYTGTENKYFSNSPYKTVITKRLLNELDLTPEQRSALVTLMDKEHAAAVEQRKEERKKGSARTDKMNALNYMDGKKSVATLVNLQQNASPELLEAALKASRGYVLNKQFDLTKSQLNKLSTISNQDNLYPYGDFYIGTIEVGSSQIQKMLNDSVNSFNSSIYQIFSDLKDLSSNLNSYVAGGMEEDALAVKAKQAAEDIATGTEEVRGA